MIEFYPQIKAAHVGLVLLSGALFAVRGLLVLLGQRRANAPGIRFLSYGIDTALLLAAVLLLVVLQLNPFSTAWVAMKLLLLAAYIVLGVLALRVARGATQRWLAYLSALATFGFMYSVARAHHPLGWFLALAGH